MGEFLRLVLLSGGYDSAAALLWALEQGPTRALFITYNQAYEKQEWRAVQRLVCMDAIAHHPNWKGRYVRGVDLAPVKGTPWIPYRNLVLSAMAAHWARHFGADRIVVGSKSTEYRPDDPISYADSTAGFYTALNASLCAATEPHQPPAPLIEAPLMGWDKKGVLLYLHTRGIPLSSLWNCYRTDGGAAPCGTCEHCTGTQPVIAQVEEAIRRVRE